MQSDLNAGTVLNQMTFMKDMELTTVLGQIISPLNQVHA